MLVQVKICVDDVKKVCQDVLDTRCREGETIECRDEIKEVTHFHVVAIYLLCQLSYAIENHLKAPKAKYFPTVKLWTNENTGTISTD